MAEVIKEVTYSESDRVKISQVATQNDMFLLVEVLQDGYADSFYIEQKYLNTLLNFKNIDSLMSYIESLPSSYLDDF